MTLDELIGEYKKMTSICYDIDYAGKKSVTPNNKAVGRMYQIVHKINLDFGDEGVSEFKKLIELKANRTDLWAAIHMLEKMSVDKETENKALSIIKEEAKQSIGMEYWLKSYYDKNNCGT